MSAVDNIVTVANLFEVVAAVQEKVGYEFQAPLDEATQNEVTSRAIQDALFGGEK